jgi:hypothetical protein
VHPVETFGCGTASACVVNEPAPTPLFVLPWLTRWSVARDVATCRGVGSSGSCRQRKARPPWAVKVYQSNMATKRKVILSATTRKRDLAAALRSAEAASSWAELTQWLRHSELILDLWRFDAKRVLFGSRPEPLAMRGREMARSIVRFADELDQTFEEPRRQALETAIGNLRVQVTRAFSGRATHLSDNCYLRSALISTIETVARQGEMNGRRPCLMTIAGGQCSRMRSCESIRRRWTQHAKSD